MSYSRLEPKISGPIYKKNVYPIHKPAAVDYVMFNYGEFLSISDFVWRVFITEKK
jgi:hypothetical protein